MFEKVNPSHPDKLADRIAGALVDMAYGRNPSPRIAVEVLLGHGKCMIIAEASVTLDPDRVRAAVERLAGEDFDVEYIEVAQDDALAENQSVSIRCGDNGIFRGYPVTSEKRYLTEIAERLYRAFPTDGKYIMDGNKLTVCQSGATEDDIRDTTPISLFRDVKINPLGYWTGGTDVDAGATNRKLGSDMGMAVTGGGLHGKDLSKADVAVNVYAHIKAQLTGEAVELCCSIGDRTVDGRPYEEIADIAGCYIRAIGGFEKFAEWGLIRPAHEGEC